MRFSTLASPRAIGLSLLVLGISPSGNVRSHGQPGATAVCDTVAVPVSGLVTLVAPGPKGVIAWTEGTRATEVQVRTFLAAWYEPAFKDFLLIPTLGFGFGWGAFGFFPGRRRRKEGRDRQGQDRQLSMHQLLLYWNRSW